MVGEIIEKEPEIVFEHECPIEEIAGFLSEDTIDKDGHKKHTLKEAEGRIKGFLAKPNVTELILRRDGELVGCAFSFEHPEEELKGKERVFEIKGVRVKFQYQKQGLGRMMVERLMIDTKQNGATKLVLSTEEDNPARRLYKKLGFTEVALNQDPRSFHMQYEYPKEK